MLKRDRPPLDRALVRLLYGIGVLWIVGLTLAIYADSHGGGSLPRPVSIFTDLMVLWGIGVLILIILAVRASRYPGIFPPDSAVVIRFRENWASGRASIFGANNCLQVTLTDNELWTRFNGPFRYMAAVQDFGLENRIPLNRILRVEPTGWAIRRAIVEYRTDEGATRRLELGLRHRDEFTSTLRTLLPSVIVS